MIWKLNTYLSLEPELESEESDMVEIGDDGSLRVDISTGAGMIGLTVPAEDMARLRAAWDERQEQLRREKGLPELEAEPDDGP